MTLLPFIVLVLVGRQFQTVNAGGYYCNGLYYDPYSSMCCNGVLDNNYAYWGDTWCCGTVAYDFYSAICCGRMMMTGVSWYDTCCGTTGYYSDSVACCDNVVVSGNTCSATRTSKPATGIGSGKQRWHEGFNRSHQRFRSERQRESELGDRMSQNRTHPITDYELGDRLSRNRTHPITNYDSGEQRWYEEFNRSHWRFRSGRQRECVLGDSMSRNRTHPITDYDSGEQRWHEEFNPERQRESELGDRMSRNRTHPIMDYDSGEQRW